MFCIFFRPHVHPYQVCGTPLLTVSHVLCQPMNQIVPTMPPVLPTCLYTHIYPNYHRHYLITCIWGKRSGIQCPVWIEVKSIQVGPLHAAPLRMVFYRTDLTNIVSQWLENWTIPF